MRASRGTLRAMIRASKSVRDELFEIANTLQLSTDFPEDVMRETEALLAAPGIDDPVLVDRSALAFVTIDAATSKDLDQAVYVAREGDGYLVAYAIADAAHYVRPGSALFAEAMRRGATYYFPGFSVPMLPRALSEGLVSLNPDGPRRALVFFHRLDADGNLLGTTLERARIASRAKLSFEAVQGLVDDPSRSPLAGREFVESLFLLREVGRKRMQLAIERGLVRYRREEVEVKLDGEGLAFAVMEVVRDEVELWNEQISLMCNAEGGRLLRENASPALQPVYRVQEGPEPERLSALAQLTERVADLHGLPGEPWRWDENRTSLADYLRGLPVGAPASREDRIARALTRQAVMVNLRSAYSIEPGPHVGVGAEPYARFSAPMRELVGVYLHHEAVEMMTGARMPEAGDERLRADVVVVANRSRETQRRVQDLSNEVVIDRLLAPELERPLHERTRYVGTVMGITANKVHVRVDAPPIDLKVYLRDLATFYSHASLEVVDGGAQLVARGPGPGDERSSTEGRRIATLGAMITLVVHRRDEANRRWILAFEPRWSQAST